MKPAWRWTRRVLILLGLLFAWGLFETAISSYADYVPRQRVKEALGHAGILKGEIDEFHRKAGTLPGAGAEREFRAENKGPAKTIEWNAQSRSLVVTMGDDHHRDTRFELVPRPVAGGLEWSCRPLTMPQKYLPSSCLNP